MTEEEIIDYLKESIEHSEYNFENFGEHNYLDVSTINAISKLLDLYNKQKEEIEELKEDNKSYKCILDMQNKREYRSKFLKDFQKENAVCFNKGLLEIVFDKNFKSIEIRNDSGEELWGNTIYNSVELTVYELQAIYEKCKELGWL